MVDIAVRGVEQYRTYFKTTGLAGTVDLKNLKPSEAFRPGVMAPAFAAGLLPLFSAGAFKPVFNAELGSEQFSYAIEVLNHPNLHTLMIPSIMTTCMDPHIAVEMLKSPLIDISRVAEGFSGVWKNYLTEHTFTHPYGLIPILIALPSEKMVDILSNRKMSYDAIDSIYSDIGPKAITRFTASQGMPVDISARLFGTASWWFAEPKQAAGILTDSDLISKQRIAEILTEKHMPRRKASAILASIAGLKGQDYADEVKALMNPFIGARARSASLDLVKTNGSLEETLAALGISIGETSEE